ncbi:u31-Nephitoxin-Nsp1c_1 [Trichonephila clavipes]|nr:u31-Nephitoxin-Nsp1c_1 [Trichonephila clavipes]
MVFVVLIAVASAEDARKAFELLGCKGTYDETKLRQVARVCDECYDLYREDTMRTLCADKCFSTTYYTGCVESIGQTESVGIYKKMVAELSGRSARPIAVFRLMVYGGRPRPVLGQLLSHVAS